MESVQDMSGCEDNQKVKYIVGSFVGKALTWWNSQIRTLGRQVDVVGDDHAAYTNRFHELARNGSIKKNPKKRGNGREPSKDRKGKGNTKRTRIENAFATTVNLVRREYTAQRPGENHQNQVMAVNRDQGHRNNGNQVRGREFMWGAEEARQDLNIMTGTDLDSTAGTDLDSTAGTDLDTTAGTDLDSTAGIDLDTTAGTNLYSTAGTDLDSIAGTDLDTTAGTGLDISVVTDLEHPTGSESPPPMLNKENYVPWSSRILRYAKSRPNRKLIHNSILNEPYVRKMIPEPGEEGQVVQRMGKKEEAGIQLQPEEYDLMAATADLDEIEEVNANCILMANLQQTSISSTQTDSALVYDSDGSAEQWNPRRYYLEGAFGSWVGHDRQMQMVGGNGGNQFRQYAGQNAGNLTGYNDVQNIRNQVIQNALQNPRVQNVGRFARDCTVRRKRRDATYLQTQLLIAQKEEAGIQLQPEEYDLMAATADLDEIEEVNANCILMANLQQTSISSTQTDSALVYDSDGSAEVHKNCDDNEIFNMFTQEEQYTELLETIPESLQVLQNDNNVISEATSMEQGGETVEQHSLNFEETRALYESLYQNLAIKVEKVNSVNRKLNETNADLTTELARFKNQTRCLEISQEKYDQLERYLQTELERTKERIENCIIKKENKYAKIWNDWYKKCDECKYDKISYDKAYNDMQQKIEWLQAQLGDLKGKSKDTSGVSDTSNPLSQKLENENVVLEFQVLNYARENSHLKATYKNLFDFISVSRTQTKTIIASLQNKLQSTIYINAKLRTSLFKKVSDQKDNTHDTSANTKFAKQPIMENLPKVIAPGMFRINPFKTSREEKHVPNIVSASARTKPITVSQTPGFTKKDVNSDLNGLSSTGVDNTKTRRPHLRSNTNHDRVPSTSKSSRSKNKEAEVKEHHMNLLLSKNNKHISLAYNNIKIDSQAVISKVVCAMCYLNLFMVRRFGLFQAYDRKSKASNQFRLEVYGNCSLQK
nr:hypothetical protein [Tanacetum cinerariifolium]